MKTIRSDLYSDFWGEAKRLGHPGNICFYACLYMPKMRLTKRVDRIAFVLIHLDEHTDDIINKYWMKFSYFLFIYTPLVTMVEMLKTKKT